MRFSPLKLALGTALSAGLIAAPLGAAPAMAVEAAAGTSPVVINEAYLSGGSTGAAYKNKFVELYNSSDAAVVLDGWSVQYRSATGTAAPTGVVALSGSIPANGYYLIQGGSNGANGAALPTPDLVAGGLNPAWAGGTLVLARQASAVNLATGSVIEPENVADLLGYGTSNTFETQPASAPAGTTDVKSLNRSDGADSNSNAADFTLSATVSPTATGGVTTPGPEPEPEPVPAATARTIAEIQGTGTASPLAGTNVITRGKVTAAFPTGGFAGYYIQTPGTGGDEDPSARTASDAVFVYSPTTAASVQIGDYVEVTGSVSEYFGMTQVTVPSAAGLSKLSVAAPEVKATNFTLPVAETDRETLEAMLLAPQGPMTVTDNYSLNQYGEIGLAGGTTPLVQPTAVAPYGSAEYTATIAENAARGIKLDDGSSTNFLKDAATKSQVLPYLTATDPVRVGSPVTFTANVVLGYANNSWKFQPLTHLDPTAADAASIQPASFGATRTDAPAEVGGNIKLASFNVLNYFPTTGDQLSGCDFYYDREGNPITVRSGCDARGAANAENFERQQAKIVEAITKSNADVITLMEIENSAHFGKNRDYALSNLVDALNVAAPGVWGFAASPANAPPLSDEDVIRNAFIYKTAVVETVGESIIHNDTVAFSNARKPLAQVFKPLGAGEDKSFIAIANHFKSKGSAATPEDTDKGQGASNLARTAQAQSLLGFANDLQASKGTDKVFLIGDFNAYAKEDPMNVFASAGYVNQDEKARNADGSAKHSYLFGGLVGSLDHILASPAADAHVTGADIWNINSVESVALEYSRYNNNVTNYYAADQFRASDHDPVVVGLDLEATPASVDVNLLNINDFHGRIDANTTLFAGTIEKLRAAAAPGATALLSAGDNIGASLFASAMAKDQPTIDVLNALELRASAVGNHEFDGGMADLQDRIIAGGTNAKFPYLGANVYTKGTSTPALQEYTVLDVNGIRVAVIGTVTQEVPSLVTPAGIADLEFGDPVDAINRVAAKITAEDLADVIVVENHDGAGSGTPEGATLEEEVAAGGAFAKLVTGTSAEVDAIFTGHTHKEYTWDAPVPGVDGKTRPIVQTGNYGENIGQIRLTVDTTTKEVTAYSAANVQRTKDREADLIAAYPRVAAVADIVKKAMDAAAVVGNEKIGSVTKDITTAFTVDPATGLPKRDDRASESTLGNLVADSLLATLQPAGLGGAEIGVVNPGGLRSELLYAPDGSITYAEANAVLPFVNNLWTTSLTGAQVKTMLEQQWQTNPDGTVPSRAYQQLGLSKNVNYTYDAARPAGDRITSIRINGEPIDPAKPYRVGTFSFLATGGDNFRIFTEGTDTRDSGLVDRDAWISYLKANSPLSPDFARRSVSVANTTAAEVKPGDAMTLAVSKLDLTSLGSPVNTALKASFTDAAGTVTELGSVPVSGGAASVNLAVPAKAAAGAGTLVLTAVESGTTVKTAVTVVDAKDSKKLKKEKDPKDPKEPKS